MVNATSTVAAALWLAIAVGTPHPSNATEGAPVGHGQRRALVTAIEHEPLAPQARISPRVTYVGLRFAGTLDSPRSLDRAAKRHTTQAARSQARGTILLAQAEHAPQTAAAGAVGASALTEEQYRMLKGFFGFDSRKVIIKILGGATATLSVDDFKRIDPAEGMNACLTMIDYLIFRGVMMEAMLAAFGRDTLLRMYSRLRFDVAGIKYGPVEELSEEEKSWLKLVSNEFRGEIKDMVTILKERSGPA